MFVLGRGAKMKPLPLPGAGGGREVSGFEAFRHRDPLSRADRPLRRGEWAGF